MSEYSCSCNAQIDYKSQATRHDVPDAGEERMRLPDTDTLPSLSRQKRHGVPTVRVSLWGSP